MDGWDKGCQSNGWLSLGTENFEVHFVCSFMKILQLSATESSETGQRKLASCSDSASWTGITFGETSERPNQLQVLRDEYYMDKDTQ